jgi:hypothetical protein
VLPPCAQTYFDLVYSGAFVRWLSRVSSIPWLLGDPWLIGGGMHVLPNGGYFDVHVDFQRHPHSGLDSRLVLLTFLNEDWREDYGGSLELWEADGSACAVRILPQMGRTVLFLQGPHMPHGVPEAVCAPLDAGRLSLAAYYYTGAVRNQNLEAPSTRFLNAARTRVYDDAKWLVKRLTPPILLDAAREMLGRASPWRHIDARQQEVIAPDKTRQNS